MSSSPAVNDRLAVVTVDVHDGDSADDIRIAADLLGLEGIRATFFVPGAVLDASHPLADALRELPRLGHEVGSHAHKHDWREIEALMRGGHTRELEFLETARTKFEDFYGFRPHAFRSPVWCRLNEMALDELVRLGYDVDSSATPQRVQMFTSRPLGRGWLLAPRSPHFIRAGLLEVPTASAVVAAGSTTFRLLRSRLSLLFVRLLLAEADVFSSRVVVLQFHSNDFNRHADREERARWELSDCLLKRYGGFGFRQHLLERDRGAVADTAWKVLRLLPPALTLSEVRRKIGGGGGS